MSRKLTNIKQNPLLFFFAKISTMSSHLKNIPKSTMTDKIRKELCEYKRDHTSCTQKDRYAIVA